MRLTITPVQQPKTMNQASVPGSDNVRHQPVESTTTKIDTGPSINAVSENRDQHGFSGLSIMGTITTDRLERLTTAKVSKLNYCSKR